MSKLMSKLQKTFQVKSGNGRPESNVKIDILLTMKQGQLQRNMM